MLRILDDHELKTQDEIEEQYPKCKYIWVFKDEKDTLGELYALSDDLESSHELYVEADRIRKSGKQCVVCGSYSDGGMAGLQFIYDWSILREEAQGS